jgi:glycosyltransferase involved in cell wall biosynthesis
MISLLDSLESMSIAGLNLLSVVMPVYNEEAVIEDVVLQHVGILERLSRLAPNWEVVCVDDGSTDGTPAALSGLAARVPQLRVVRHQTNQGIFASFRDGYREARGSHIYSTGSDGQWPAENLALLLPRLASGAALVVGVRTNRREVYSHGRRVVSFAFNFLPALLLGTQTHDAGSVKLGIREVFATDLISHSPFVEAERILKASRSGHRVDFVPIQFVNRRAGKAKGASLKNVSSAALDLLRCVKAYGFR